MKKIHNEKRGNRMHTLGSLLFYMAKMKRSVAAVDTVFCVIQHGSFKKQVITSTIGSERQLKDKLHMPYEHGLLRENLI